MNINNLNLNYLNNLGKLVYNKEKSFLTTDEFNEKKSNKYCWCFLNKFFFFLNPLMLSISRT